MKITNGETEKAKRLQQNITLKLKITVFLLIIVIIWTIITYMCK